MGFFDEDRRLQNCEDYDLWLRLARAGSTFYGMTDKLIRYRRHSTSSTHSESKLLGPMIEVMKKHSEDVDHRTSQKRIRGLYRELIATLLAEDDLVVVLVTVNAERNGLSASFPEIHVWRMKDGKATDFREYQGDEQREDRFWS